MTKEELIKLEQAVALYEERNWDAVDKPFYSIDKETGDMLYPVAFAVELEDERSIYQLQVTYNLTSMTEVYEYLNEDIPIVWTRKRPISFEQMIEDLSVAMYEDYIDDGIRYRDMDEATDFLLAGDSEKFYQCFIWKDIAINKGENLSYKLIGKL